MKEILIRNKNVIHQFLLDGVPLRKVKIASGLKPDRLTTEIVNLAHQKSVPVDEIPYQYMEKGRSGKTREVIVALFEPSRPLSLTMVLQKLRTDQKSPFLLLINRVALTSNVGLIARTAFAAGVDALVFQGEEAQFMNEDTIHLSMGTIARIPFVKMGIFEALKELKQAGIPTYALDMKGVVYSQQNLRGPLALVVGEEGEGVSDPILKRCSGTLAIPMKPGIESLNVGASAAIVLYEKVRQEGSGG